MAGRSVGSVHGEWLLAPRGDSSYRGDDVTTGGGCDIIRRFVCGMGPPRAAPPPSHHRHTIITSP